MNPSERIDYLVRYLAGNNAREFAKVTGIDPATVSKLRKGGNPHYYFARIAKVYPDVNADWLESGEGVPFKSIGERSEISDRLARIEATLLKISKTLEKISKTTGV